MNGRSRINRDRGWSVGAGPWPGESKAGRRARFRHQQPMHLVVGPHYGNKPACAHPPAGGSHSSALLPSGSITQPNLPNSDSSTLSTTSQPSLRRTPSKACRSATR